MRGNAKGVPRGRPPRADLSGQAPGPAPTHVMAWVVGAPLVGAQTRAGAGMHCSASRSAVQRLRPVPASGDAFEEEASLAFLES